ncbi:MAG TPA: ATP-dependent DNA helicase [Mycobacteriales bacterium]|nr:ATP-dependent DNA helicase [Mycobacteriales bacterium]
MGDASAVAVLRAIVDERPGGEHRPQQEALVEAVETALADREHLLVQAGTGTGKSLGYLIPAVLSGKRIVVSTATKQLGEQLVLADLPMLATLLPKIADRDLTYAIIKGRSNYACQAKVDELRPAELPPLLEVEEPPEALALFEVERPPPPPTPVLLTAAAKTVLDDLLDWAQATTTGDRSEAPQSVTDLMWREVSTDTAGCPGAHVCSFGATCFTEKARREAKNAQIVVTNHALVAQDLGNPTAILGDWDAVVFDEAHELVDVLSEAWASVIAPMALHATVGIAGRRLSRDDESDTGHLVVEQLQADLDTLSGRLSALDPGLLVRLPDDVKAALTDVAHGLTDLSTRLDETPPTGEDKNRHDAAARNAELVRTARGAAAALLSDDGQRVRWLRRGRRENGPGELVSAPLWVGPELVRRLGERTLVATSATLTVAGRFEPVAQSLGLLSPRPVADADEPAEPRRWTGLDVGTPFDYDKQAILYVPDPKRFPAPIGRDRTEHTAAVLEELTQLVRAAGGRTLALFTTTAGATQAAEHLRRTIDTPVLAQGDAPVGQLVQRFAEDEPTTLCGTMGLWHGVDVPGASLSCLVLDKLPFAPMDDPLMAARRSATDDAGRDGFTEVFVANATVKITQGVGRLIRTSTDRGVVAVLDTRVRTKGYGRLVLQSLPPMRLMSDLDLVTGALRRLTGTAPS